MVGKWAFLKPFCLFCNNCLCPPTPLFGKKWDKCMPASWMAGDTEDKDRDCLLWDWTIKSTQEPADKHLFYEQLSQLRSGVSIGPYGKGGHFSFRELAVGTKWAQAQSWISPGGTTNRSSGTFPPRTPGNKKRMLQLPGCFLFDKKTSNIQGNASLASLDLPFLLNSTSRDYDANSSKFSYCSIRWRRPC